jgi:hypothetical protein
MVVPDDGVSPELGRRAHGKADDFEVAGAGAIFCRI